MTAGGLRTSETAGGRQRSTPRTAFVVRAERRRADIGGRSLVLDAWSRAGAGWRAGAVATAAVALVATRSGDVPLASGLAVTVLVAAALVDRTQRRLPNHVVLAAAAVFVVGAAVHVAAGGTIGVTNVVVGVFAMSGPLLIVHLVSPTAMGFGDVKAAMVLGATVGTVDWQLAVTALALAAGLTATVGVVARATTIAFGPGLVAGATIALAAHSLLLPAGPPVDPAAVDAPGFADRTREGSTR